MDSIYSQTLQKVRRLVPPEALDDKHLILHFVKIERALRQRDLEMTQMAVWRLRQYLKKVGRHQLIRRAHVYVTAFNPHTCGWEFHYKPDGYSMTFNFKGREQRWLEDVAICCWAKSLSKRSGAPTARLETDIID